jgi:hypothetical protein
VSVGGIHAALATDPILVAGLRLSHKV